MSTAQRPNIIFILTDDQGYGDLACHGNPVVRTPHLDRLHAESVRLTNYHCGPFCAPTRAGLLTGRYAHSTGVWHTNAGRSLLRQDEVSMADFFGRAGYVTGLFGKWHLGDNYPYRPQDRGFQVVVAHGGGGVGQTPDYWGNDYFDDTYWVYRADGKPLNGKPISPDGAHQHFAGYCTDVWFEQALGFIDEHKTQPFFCYIPTNAPHTPHLVDPSYSEPYVAETPHAERANYFGMVTNIDENVGRLRRQLAEWGLAHNTILIFMTDNGSHGGVDVDANQFVINGHNAGMRGRKGSEYEGGHRVPFFMHWPQGGYAKGEDVSELTANIDILPTLLELCGVDQAATGQLDGTSLVPLLAEPHAPWPDRTLITESNRMFRPVKWHQSAVMTKRWRLIRGQELYDITLDPEQRHDIAAQHPAVVAELRTAYEAWWAQVSAQFDADIPIPIGHADWPQLRLNTHDWRNQECLTAWNQNYIRQGLRCNGYWELEVVRAGTYRFELRRWPREEARGIGQGIPGAPVPFDSMTLESGYGGGAEIPVQSARLKIGTHEETQTVAPHAAAVLFTVDLAAGPTHLQTWFATTDGQNLGAYYVYIEKLATQ